MTTTSLRNQNCKELAQLARAMGLAGWHSMRKDELIRALVNHGRRKPKRPSDANRISSAIAILPRKSQEAAGQLGGRLAEMRQIASANGHKNGRKPQDRLVVMVRDPYWLHA